MVTLPRDLLLLMLRLYAAAAAACQLCVCLLGLTKFSRMQDQAALQQRVNAAKAASVNHSLFMVYVQSQAQQIGYDCFAVAANQEQLVVCTGARLTMHFRPSTASNAMRATSCGLAVTSFSNCPRDAPHIQPYKRLSCSMGCLYLNGCLGHQV